MRLSYSRSFKKMFRKQTASVQRAFETRLALFVENPYHLLLYNHALHGEWLGCRSINITGDIRAVFEELQSNHFEFVAVGNHSELYS